MKNTMNYTMNMNTNPYSKKNSYAIMDIASDRLDFLKRTWKSFTFTGKMIMFDDGSSYPIVDAKYVKWTPYHLARHTPNGYIVAMYERYLLCKGGKIIDNDYDGN